MSSPSLQKASRVCDWLSMDRDGVVQIASGKVDIGQRITAALARIAADELDLPLSRVEVLAARTSAAPDEGYTAGSNSVAHSGGAVRAACATARRSLVHRAAVRLGVDVGALSTADGLVRDVESNASIRYEELLDEEPFDIPVDPNCPTKASSEFRFVGQPLMEPANPRGPSTRKLVAGRLEFVHDLAFDGMLHARVVRPPHYHARLRTLPPDTGLGQGIEVIRDGSFIAVVGEDEYATLQAAERLAAQIEWHDGVGLKQGDLYQALLSNARQSLPVVDGTPQAREVPPRPEAPPEATHVFEAVYERPYQMHGTIGPSAAAALYESGALTVWSHTQGIYPLRAAVAEVLKLDPEQVTVQHVPGAGCYGHNGADDAGLDAALIARARPGRPILLKWTREDEHAWEPYGSCMSVSMRAAVTPDGDIMSWAHESFSDTHVNRPRPGSGTGGARLIGGQLIEAPLTPAPATPNLANHSGIHRNAEPLYDIPLTHVVKHLVAGLPLRTSSMRTLGAVANVFAIECFLDEIALALELDPVQLRIDHLSDNRARGVLADLRVHTDGWGSVEGTGLGVGFSRYKNSAAYAAVAVEVEVAEDAVVKLLRAHVSVDAGQIVDPDGTAAQLEGGLLQAASWALYESVSFDAGGITSRDWDSYPILRFDNVPEIEVNLLDLPDEPSLGVGEASSGPAVAAIANAIFRACGVRIRRMPFNIDNLRQAAAAA